jgi:hypothetical protein
LIEFLLYVEDTAVNEDMLFCNPTKRRATAKELFKIVDDLMKLKRRHYPAVLQYARLQVG